MKTYTTSHLVKSEDLNHHGTLFAARAAAWLVEAGFSAAVLEHGSMDDLVMRNLLSMSFTKPVQKGTMLLLESRVVMAGTTSLTTVVKGSDALKGTSFFEGYITYVCIDQEKGGKKPHGISLDEAGDEEEIRQRQQAEKLFNATK